MSDGIEKDLFTLVCYERDRLHAALVEIRALATRGTNRQIWMAANEALRASPRASEDLPAVPKGEEKEQLEGLSSS